MPTETETEYVVTVKAGGSGGPKLQGVYTCKDCGAALNTDKFAKVPGSENLLNSKQMERVLDAIKLDSKAEVTTLPTVDSPPPLPRPAARPPRRGSGGKRRTKRKGGNKRRTKSKRSKSRRRR